jgi:hypothetical protein
MGGVFKLKAFAGGGGEDEDWGQAQAGDENIGFITHVGPGNNPAEAYCSADGGSGGQIAHPIAHQHTAPKLFAG